MFRGNRRYVLVFVPALAALLMAPAQGEAQCLDRLRALFGCGGTSTTAYMVPTTAYSPVWGAGGCSTCATQTSYYATAAYRPVMTLRPVTSYSRTVSMIPSYRVAYSPVVYRPLATAAYYPPACDPCGTVCDPCGGGVAVSGGCASCVQMPIQEETGREALKPTPAEEEPEDSAKQNGNGNVNGAAEPNGASASEEGEGPAIPGPANVQGSGYRAPPAARPPAPTNPNDRTAARPVRTVAPVRLISAPGLPAPPPVDQIDTGGWEAWRD